MNLEKTNNINLSIIIPHFNTTKLLLKLLKSIPRKDFIQIIVIDDKSEQIEINVINEFRKNHEIEFELYHNTTEYKGAGVCRNIGIEKAKGSWILFADSDDYFTEYFYDSVSKYFNSRNDVVFFSPTSVFLDTNEIANRHNNIYSRLNKYIRNKDLASELELRYKLDGPISKLINREFLVKNLISFEEVLAANDILFSTKVGFYMKEFEISNDVIYVITQGKNSLTTNRNKEIFDIRFNEKVKYYKFLESRLSKKELKILNIAFLDFLFRSRIYGIKTIYNLFKVCLNENIPIVDKRLYSFKSIIKLFKKILIMNEIDKKYENKIKI